MNGHMNGEYQVMDLVSAGERVPYYLSRCATDLRIWQSLQHLGGSRRATEASDSFTAGDIRGCLLLSETLLVL